MAAIIAFFKFIAPSYMKNEKSLTINQGWYLMGLKVVIAGLINDKSVINLPVQFI